MQIGDVHYDQAVGGPDVDIKDPGISDAMIEETAPGRLQAVMKRLQQLCERRTPDAIVFCGDLTTRGALPVYRDCVSYLDDNLALKAERYWEQSRVHAVPGNHDVDRATAGKSGSNLFNKFDPLTQVWRDAGVDIFRPSEVRITALGSPGCDALGMSLNSCIGCGEQRYRGAGLPDGERETLETRAASGDADASDVLWEALDTPLFSQNHLETVMSTISDADRALLPLVFTHHNLLPQATPRADVYTELLNGGAARTRLSSARRWVVYLHGHIHADPIEIIDQRHPSTGCVLSISAPLFTDGFNLLTFDFGKGGRPLGCTVSPYRYERGGDVRPLPEIRVPLRSPNDDPDDLITELLRLLTPYQGVRFRKLKDDFFSHDQPNGVSEQDFCDALLEAEWAGYLMVTERDDSPVQWTITRRTP